MPLPCSGITTALTIDQYNAIGEFLASNLNADRDDQRVVDGMIAVQNTAFELCGHPDFDGAWHKLAVFCGQNSISFHTVDAIRDFLRRFSPDDARIDDFEATAKGMLRAYSGLDDLKTATAHANGVHGVARTHGIRTACRRRVSDA